MNNLTERYIYDVTRRLPEKERADVKRELEANINDMLPENPSEQAVADVLTKLGEPRILAEQYRQKPRYLISPAMFEQYVTVLKTVSSIAALVCACVGVMTSLSAGSVSEIFGSALGMAFNGALYAALWVTVGFVIAERVGYKPEPWTVEKLPDLPDNKVRIPRSESIAGLIVTTVFTILFMFMLANSEWFFIAVRNSEIVPPFSDAARLRLIPFVAISGVLAAMMHMIKLIWAKWSVPVFAANLIYNIIWVGIAVHIIHWQDLINDKFWSVITTAVGVRVSASSSRTGILIASGLFIVIAAVEIISSGVKTIKGVRART